MGDPSSTRAEGRSFFWNRCRIDWNKAVMCLQPTKTSPLSCFLTIRHCSLLSNVLFGKNIFILWRSSKLTAILSESCSYNCMCAPGGYPPHPRELEPELQRGVHHLRPRRPQGQPRQVPAHRQHRPSHCQVSAATRSISSERVSSSLKFSSVSTTLY